MRCKKGQEGGGETRLVSWTDYDFFLIIMTVLATAVMGEVVGSVGRLLLGPFSAPDVITDEMETKG